MDDFNIIPEPKWLKIGKHKYDVSRISAIRQMKAAALYNKKIMGVEQEDGSYRKYDSDLELMEALLEVVFILFQVDVFFINPFEWIKRKLVTKRHLLKSLSGGEFNDFIEDALEPIIGDKKKELKRQNAATDAMLKLLETEDPELLAKLLQNSVLAQGIQENMPSTS